MDHKVELTLTPQRICDLFVAALEGGSNYWLRGIDYRGAVEPEEKWFVWWCSANVFADAAFAAEVTFDDPEGEEGNGKGKKLITHADIQRGLDLLKDADKGNPVALGRIIAEDEDANDADMFMQLVVIGDVIYG